ncbi:hypothetical protein LTR66_003667 [Elasticomyces elasticus]|nr:hypothetical protein LTR50_006652 [Elasticomyces elasticus]KAK4996798.1 hypothetical protein LTR66_003667 [Elasticomyces elasticus]
MTDNGGQTQALPSEYPSRPLSKSPSKVRSLSDTTSTLAPSPMFHEKLRASKDDHAIDGGLGGVHVLVETASDLHTDTHRPAKDASPSGLPHTRLVIADAAQRPKHEHAQSFEHCDTYSFVTAARRAHDLRLTSNFPATSLQRFGLFESMHESASFHLGGAVEPRLISCRNSKGHDDPTAEAIVYINDAGSTKSEPECGMAKLGTWREVELVRLAR